MNPMILLCALHPADRQRTGCRTTRRSNSPHHSTRSPCIRGRAVRTPGSIELPAGISRIRMVLVDELPVEGTPDSLDTYHFTTEGCTLLQSSLGLVTIPPGAEARSEHQRLLDEQLQRVRIAERAAESARSSLELLDSMGRTMSEQVDFTDPEAIRTLHAFLSEQREVAILAVDEGRTLATELTTRNSRQPRHAPPGHPPAAGGTPRERGDHRTG